MGRERTAGGRRHGAVGAAQAASAVLVVGGVALGALLLHPDTALFAKGRGPLGGNPVLVFGLALLALLGGLMLRDRYRDRVGAAGELAPGEQRVAEGVSRVLMVGSLVVPVLVLVLHRFGSTDRSGGAAAREPLPIPSPVQDPTPSASPVQQAGQAGRSTQSGLMHILLGVGIALLVAVVVIAGLFVWRQLTRRPVPEPPVTYATLEDEQGRLAEAVDAGRRALLEGSDARAAVIACYAAMVESLADSGVARRASDSPQDLLDRATTDGLPTGTAAAALTALFREARYSTHPMGAGHRDRAAAALAEIADGLRARTVETEAETEAGSEAGSEAVSGVS